MKEPNVRRPGPFSPLLQVTIDPNGPTPLYRQVYEALRESILQGRLAPGARLPSTRALAEDLGVSRNTVLLAFERLGSEGYLVGRRGGGTRVRSTMPGDREAGRVRRQTARAAGNRGGGKGTSASAPAVRISDRVGRLIQSSSDFLLAGGAAPAPFDLGVSAVDAFPTQLWARLAGRRWRHAAGNLGDADAAGEAPLRAAIAGYLETSRDARCTPDQVLVVNGAQQALYLIAQVLLNPGETVWMENPGYVGARAAFEAAEARLVPVPVDREGLDVDTAERIAPDARLAYVTPSHQFPLGVLMSAPRRLQLLEWARNAPAWIVEDDYDSEFRYTGRPLPCLQGMEADQASSGTSRVLYVGTFGKTLAPALRLGYLVVPDELVDVFRAARAAIDRHSPTPDQGVLADFVGEGHYGRHIRLARRICARRQEALLEAAGRRLDGLLTLQPDPAGLHLAGWLPAGVDDRAAGREAVARGVRVSPLSRFCIGAPSPEERSALLLGYAAHDTGAIRHGVEQLASALEVFRKV